MSRGFLKHMSARFGLFLFMVLLGWGVISEKTLALSEAECQTQFGGECDVTGTPRDATAWDNKAICTKVVSGVITNGNCYVRRTVNGCTGTGKRCVSLNAGACDGTTEQEDTSISCGTGSVCCVRKTNNQQNCAGSCTQSINVGCTANQTQATGFCANNGICCVDRQQECTATSGATCTNSVNVGCNAATQNTIAGHCASGGSCCVAKNTGGTGNVGSNSSTSASITFTNPLQFDTFQGLLTQVLSYLQGIIVSLALLFIVIGGVLYITSAGNESRIKTAKAAITAAMIGMAIGVAAPTFLKEIASILGWSDTSGATTSALSLSTIILNTLNFLLGIAGILAVIMFVIGGVMYLTSGGDDRRTDTSKEILKASAIGITIVLAALIIVKQIVALLS